MYKLGIDDQAIIQTYICNCMLYNPVPPVKVLCWLHSMHRMGACSGEAPHEPAQTPKKANVPVFSSFRRFPIFQKKYTPEYILTYIDIAECSTTTTSSGDL